MPGPIENKNPAAGGYIPRETSIAKITGGITTESGVIGAHNNTLAGVNKGQKTDRSEAHSVPDLPPIDEKKVDWSKFDGINILALLGLEQNKNSLKAAESDVKMNLDQQKKTAEDLPRCIFEASPHH